MSLTNLSEDKLCELFADKLVSSSTFAFWILNQTKFSAHAANSRILHEEQAAIRPRKHWWRHWWCALPNSAIQSETDIFVVFERADRSRFALHMENKKLGRKFEPRQEELYLLRAQHMMNKPECLGYSDFQTVLIAPEIYRQREPTRCAGFGCFISYEAIAAFISEFAN